MPDSLKKTVKYIDEEGYYSCTFCGHTERKNQGNAGDCPVCKKEVPKLDSVYNAVLKNKGVKVYSIASGGELDKVQQFIKDNKIEDWINVADVNNNTGFKEKYDAYSTPKIYLLDEDKKIIGKGLDHSNINTVIEISEKKKI